MCGIAGILNLNQTEPPPPESVLRRMLGAIRHRGPDEFGMYLGDSVALGNARLSIVDLSGGSQPISNEDETLWIVFNGEIFNHIELRADLEARGHKFQTHCDTEVIVHLYEEYGLNCFNRMNGQWAIAIWDTKRRQLLLSRDRLGVRPLFYHKSKSHFIFGSEIKAVMGHPAVLPEIDPAALEQVFVYWSSVDARTIFKDVRQAHPGHYIIISEDGFEEKPYWQMGFPPQAFVDAEGQLSHSHDFKGDVADLSERLRETLLDAVRIRLRADVPVGAYLSGGLDSSIIAACVKHLNVSRLDTFSITFQDPQFDESEHQMKMSKALGTEHQVAYVKDSDIGEVFPEVIWHAETPLMRTGPAPMYLLSKLVRSRNYKVVLTGEGADEFLAGYDIFKETKIRRFWANNPDSKWRANLLNRLYADVQGLNSVGGAYLRGFFSRGLTETDSPHYSHAIRWGNNRRTTRFLAPELVTDGKGDSEIQGALTPPPNFNSWDTMQRAQFWEINVFLSRYLLSSQGDRVGMANSIEGRFPFLDYRVVDFSSRVPSRLKMRGLTEKYLLRKAFEAWLPPEIGNRPKRAYRAPIRRCFLGPNSPAYVRDLLSETELKKAGLFNVPAVVQLVSKFGEKPASETDEMALVGVLSTQLLRSEFGRRVNSSRPIDEKDRVKIVTQRGAGAALVTA